MTMHDNRDLAVTNGLVKRKARGYAVVTTYEETP